MVPTLKTDCFSMSLMAVPILLIFEVLSAMTELKLPLRAAPIAIFN
jgi:hypothetical protein